MIYIYDFYRLRYFPFLFCLFLGPVFGYEKHWVLGVAYRPKNTKWEYEIDTPFPKYLSSSFRQKSFVIFLFYGERIHLDETESFARGKGNVEVNPVFCLGHSGDPGTIIANLILLSKTNTNRYCDTTQRILCTHPHTNVDRHKVKLEVPEQVLRLEAIISVNLLIGNLALLAVPLRFVQDTVRINPLPRTDLVDADTFFLYQVETRTVIDEENSNVYQSFRTYGCGLTLNHMKCLKKNVKQSRPKLKKILELGSTWPPPKENRPDLALYRELTEKFHETLLLTHSASGWRDDFLEITPSIDLEKISSLLPINRRLDFDQLVIDPIVQEWLAHEEEVKPKEKVKKETTIHVNRIVEKNLVVKKTRSKRK